MRYSITVGGVQISSDERFASSLGYIENYCGGLIEALADVIITDCKAFYIAESVKLPIHDKVSRHAFVAAMLAFDRDTDRIIVKSLLRLTQEFYLDSFYDFCIHSLKTRWDEVCLLANENKYYLSDSAMFGELLHFLISNIECELDDTMFMHIREESMRDDVRALFGTHGKSV